MEALISNSVDYKLKDKASPRYKLQRLSPVEGTPVLSVTGTSTSTIQVPPVIHNHSQSYARFKMVPAQGTNYNYLMCNTLPFSSLILRDEGNVQIANIQYLNKYFNTVINDSVSDAELKSQDLAIGATGPNGFFSGIRACQTVASGNRRYEAGATGIGTVPYVERQYAIVGFDNTATPVVEFRIPMWIIKKSFFSMDKNIFHNKSLYLEFQWAPAQSYIVNATGNADMATGHALPGVPTISDFFYELAVQTNEELNIQIKKLYQSAGIKLFVPNIVSSKKTLTGAGSQVLELNYSRTHGMHLQEIYSVPYNTTETLETALMHRNGKGVVAVSSFTTSLNGDPLQNALIDCTKGDDYLHMRKYLLGSMTQSSEVYNYNWFWKDSFAENSNHSDVLDGVSLDTEHKYTLSATAIGDNLWYTFAICKRLCELRPDGIIVS